MLYLLLSVFKFFLGVAVVTSSDWVVPRALLLLPGILLLLKRPLLALVFCGFLLGALRAEVYEGVAFQGVLGTESVQIEGRVVEEVDRRLDEQRLMVEAPQGKVLVKVSPYYKVHYGDTVRLYGVLERPTEDIDGFNYAAYLARYGVWLVMDKPHIELVAAASWSFKGALFAFKERLDVCIKELYFEPEASFAVGLLLGSRAGMPKELSEAFQQVGLTHVVAISGYNISLLISLMFSFFYFLPLKTRVFVSTVAIGVFVILVGASAAVVRAGVMGLLTLWAMFTGRRSQVFFALVWSAFFMVLSNPYVLLYDVGFQLSFLSTFGLLTLEPWLSKKIPGKAGVFKEAFVLSLAAQIATTPLTLFNFGRLSLVSPLANVLAAPFLPLAMLFSGLSLLFGSPLAWIAWFPLRAVEQVALILGSLPWASVPLKLSFPVFCLLNLLALYLLLRSYKSTLVRGFRLGGGEATSRVCDFPEQRHERSKASLA